MIKKKYTNEYIKLIYYISILPLLLYSCYKNGFLLYQKHFISILGIFKPFLIVFTTFILALTLDYTINRFLKKRKNLKTYLLNSYNTLLCVLFSLTIPINANLILYYILVIILLFILNYLDCLKINNVALIKLLFIFVLSFFGKVSYQNTYEANVLTLYTTFDLFFGRSIGGLATSNAFLLIISFGILCLIPSYKKNIPINIILSYLFILFISCLFGNDLKEGLKLILSNELLFSSIFIATIPMYSPITNNEYLLYSFLIGVCGFIFTNYISLKEGFYLAILLSSIVILLLHKLKINIDKE